MAVKDYIRERFFPHMWCQGCGNGTVMSNMIRALEQLGLDKNEIVLVTGIGCSARMAGYVDAHTMHTLHGRALAFAMGVKMSRPELTLIVPMGDGDAFSAGGNHFINAARRNVDMTAIIVNNRVYGMTGGQFSAMSGAGTTSTTSPYKTIDPAFDAASLAVAAGATFVARTTTYHVRQLRDYIARAIDHKGFSVVEVMSQCPTYFGRKNKIGDPVKMLEQTKADTPPIGSNAILQDTALTEIGVFVEREAPEYCEQYQGVMDRAMKDGPDE